MGKLMENVIFNIQRFCVKDGPGIRTTVFLKGCPLNCVWCHNPESKEKEPIIVYDNSKCVNCNECIKVCEQKAIKDLGEIDRENCNLCGKCISVCCGALELWGESQTKEQVFEIVLKDKAFYDNSNGGLTISGGEPLYNLKFTKELLKLAKQNNVNTCIETCGFAKWENITEIIPFVDLFLYDIKETDSVLHKKYTGVDNSLILQNLKNLSDIGAKIILRCPIIPTYNDRKEHLEQIGVLAETLKGVEQIEIMPYHPMGKTKSQLLGVKYEIEQTFSTNEQIEDWAKIISSKTNKKVIKN